MKKEPDKRGPSIAKFFAKLGSKHGPYLKKALDEMVNTFEKNPSVKFEFFHVRGHQKVKQFKDLKTEEDYNAYWNDRADKLVDEVRQMGEIANGIIYVALKAGDKISEPNETLGKDIKELNNFVNKNQVEPNLSERIVSQAHSLTNVNVRYYLEPKLVEKKIKPETRVVRITHQA